MSSSGLSVEMRLANSQRVGISLLFAALRFVFSNICSHTLVGRTIFLLILFKVYVILTLVD